LTKLSNDKIALHKNQQAKELNNFMHTENIVPTKDAVHFTDAAQQHFKQAVEHSKAIGVRLSLDGGGCAGFSYKWKLIFDLADVDETDYNKTYDGWKFWLDKTSEMYLVGSVVDKKVDIIGSVIDIQSPLASSSCGCGESVNFNL